MIRPEIPEAFIPQLTYYPILVNEMSTETLLRVHNAVAAVFYVENADPQKRFSSWPSDRDRQDLITRISLH